MILLDSIVDYVRNYSYDDMEVTLFDEDRDTNIYLLVDIKYKTITYNISLYNDENGIFWSLSKQTQNRTIKRPLHEYKDYDYLISLIQNEKI